MSAVLRILATTLRALFLAALIVIIARVSSPQSETVWTVHETPEDMFRLGLGLAACVWLVVHMFMFPQDVEGYRDLALLRPRGRAARMDDRTCAMVNPQPTLTLDASRR